MNNHKNNSGFTLIEIMVTVAIVGIFASVALPSFSRLIESNRINTATNELVANLLLTRSEALKRRNAVTLCPSSNQTSCNTTDYSAGWVVFLDCDADGVIDISGTDADGDPLVTGCVSDASDDIIKVGDGFDSIAMTNAQDHITFNFTGRPAGVSTFSVGRTGGTTTKQVSINLVGRIKATTIP
ncbi:MAG: GspH/FimT family pseudopilin [Cocleimonas sp.]